MTLDQIIKIQSIIDKRAIRSDTLEILDIKRYSKSLGAKVRYGNMHIDHFLTVMHEPRKELEKQLSIQISNMISKKGGTL